MPSPQPGSPAVPGLPVGLSTAKWHLRGTATIKAGINNSPNASANTAATLDLSNWTVAVDFGAGVSPVQPPANTPSAWPATGDGIPSYLSWVGNNGSIVQTKGSGVQGQSFAEKPLNHHRVRPLIGHASKMRARRALRHNLAPIDIEVS